MYPSARITKPEPVPEPLLDTVEMETTEGKTRAAMPAIESEARSMVDVEVDNAWFSVVFEDKPPAELGDTPCLSGPESEKFAATYPTPPPSTPATNVMTRRSRTGSRVVFETSTFHDEIGSKRAG